MAIPMTNHAPNNVARPCAAARAARPMAKSTFEAQSTGRPPRSSIKRPAKGPQKAEIPSPRDSEAKIQEGVRPRSRDMGPASTAGR